MHGPLARQVRRHRFAAVLDGLAGACWDCWRLPVGSGCASFAFRYALFELAEREFELLNLPVELLRGAAEPRPPQFGELRLEVLDLQRLGVEFGVAHRDHPIPFGELGLPLGEQRFLLDHHPPQRADIAGQCGRFRDHAQHNNLIRRKNAIQLIVS